MSDTEQDTKPTIPEAAGDEKSKTITLRVKDQAGEETFFKVKKTTKMIKVFEAYAGRKGVGAATLRFLVDGQRIREDDTPMGLDLEDQDQIDCMLQQTGGN